MGLFIVKLGGSAISDKTKPLSYREDWVRDLGKLLLTGVRAGNRFVLVHGGGSFAHPLALAYGLSRYRDNGQLTGVSLTSAILHYLSMKITMTLATVGLPIYPLRTGSIYVISNGKPQLLISPIHILELLKRGVVPMMYGDVVPSDEGFSIISGDDIMLDLSSKLRPSAAVFLTDVPGILDSNGNLIRELSSSSIINERNTRGIDVTGGLMKKVQSAIELSNYARTYLCAIWDLKSITSIINNEEPSNCTRFLPRTKD
ncbi:isopentenyl phosphate kinase [Vulcanisaeta souniana]|uniref:Isopentenyl phosphate kinase n=1 Tax=Vulcanisaeta souniana JCM 11219 TaxID=1293586 RepID=A0A830ECT7_9CREN|nr:isopentenyl phosphate kinase [Vulcanisaeta souniana]BDR91336.1 aspartate/glutamate/uridylate kinase [Vulcanisaeta souniana JCM 11219]GGI72440.1 aspartate/glutamate/uridylate kinase [Vulcanisaeta souniana JCM 11219]